MVVDEIVAGMDRAAEKIGGAEAFGDDVGGSDAEQLGPYRHRIGVVFGVAAIASGPANGGQDLARHHFRNRFAAGLRLVKTSLYRPESLTVRVSCGPPGVGAMLTPYSSSSRPETAMR